MRRSVGLAAAVVSAAALAAVSGVGADYANLSCHLRAPRCDEPAYPLSLLAHAQFAGFVHAQPLMGPVSLALRAPFAAVANWIDADLTWQYRLTLFPCLVVLALLALALARQSRASRHSWPHAVAVAALAFVSPVVISTIESGHPEELVAAAAIVGAALLVLRGRYALAAVALGLALATKAWAVLVVIPFVLAVPAPARRRFAAIGIVVVLASYAPLVAGDPTRFREVADAAGSLGSQYGEATVPNVWFFTADRGVFRRVSGIRNGQLVYARAPGYAVTPTVARLAHAVALAAALALAAAWWHGGGARRPEGLLLVTAAILMLRCALDPGNHLYYHAAAALSLLGLDAVRRGGRMPWLGGGFILALWLLTRVNDHLRTDTAFASVYLAFAVLTLAGLAFIACLRSRSTPPTPRLRISRRHATGSSRA